MDLHNEENKVWFLVGSFIGILTSIEDIYLAELFPIVLVKAILIAAASGFAGLFGKYLFQMLMKKFIKKERQDEKK